MTQFRKKYEEEALKLSESERAVNSLEIDVRSTIKQNEQQRKMMQERIAQL